MQQIIAHNIRFDNERSRVEWSGRKMIEVVWSVVFAIEVSAVARSNAIVVMNGVRGYSIMILINSMELYHTYLLLRGKRM